MKLFQQLLVAPAALGLLAPVAASAADINLAGVNKYAAEEQVTSISQFGDVKPTDWAYQALSNLIERYGCVAGYPDGTYKGQRAMTRFEAAALLNACLDRVSEVTDELKKLMAEFEKELAILKGRVDGLEAKVGVLEAQQFSATTKLKGVATMVLGGVSYGSNAEAALANPSFASGAPRVIPGTLTNGLSFNYDVRLTFDTSFSGKDLLRTTLRAGNAGGSAFASSMPFGVGLDVRSQISVTPGTALEAFFQAPTVPGRDSAPTAANNIVGINRLFYQFPLGGNVTATFGALVRQDDMLALWPSVYPADGILNLFSYAGSPLTYNLALGGGAGLWWQQNGFSISASTVSQNAGSGLSTVAAGLGGGGVGNTNSASTSTVQVGYAGKGWGAAAAYSYVQLPAGSLVNGTNFLNVVLSGAYTNTGSSEWSTLSSSNSLALSAYWQPSRSGWLPSISAGWGLGTTTLLTGTGADQGGFGFTSNSWMLGLQWQDAFVHGNVLGFAVGQNTMVSKMTGNLSAVVNGNSFGFAAPQDGNYAWEWWYKLQVTDNISVTPAVFYLSNPLGQDVTVGGNGAFFNSFGYLIKTTFRF